MSEQPTELDTSAGSTQGDNINLSVSDSDSRDNFCELMDICEQFSFFHHNSDRILELVKELREGLQADTSVFAGGEER